MARQEILDRIQNTFTRFASPKARAFAEGYRPSETCGLKLDKGEAADLLQPARRGSRRSRRCSTPRTAGRCCSFSRPWTRPARTARSSTSCQASIRKAARSSRSSNLRRKISITISCGDMRRRLPERGRIGIFNRSYYEEVLVVRVHEEILKRQRLPRRWLARASGTNGSLTSRISRTTSPGRARSFSSSS